MFRIHLTQVDAMATDAKVGVNISLTHSTQILVLKSVDTLTDSFEDFTAGLSNSQLSNVWTHEAVPMGQSHRRKRSIVYYHIHHTT